MAESLGTLIDKLVTANVKLFHVEGVRRDLNIPDKERLEASDLVTILNKERNGLVQEIDEYLVEEKHRVTKHISV